MHLQPHILSLKEQKPGSYSTQSMGMSLIPSHAFVSHRIREIVRDDWEEQLAVWLVHSFTVLN
jgi:hypothetical protein